jgi:hypothetical protein
MPVMTDQPRRRFQPPWTIEEANNACFAVKDGFAVSYVYFEIEFRPAQCRQSHDEGRSRRIASNTAKLTALIGSA